MAWAETHRLLIHGRLLLAGHPWGIDGMSAYDVMAVVQAILVELMLHPIQTASEATAVDLMEAYLTDVWGRGTAQGTTKQRSAMEELMEMRAEMGQGAPQRLNIPTTGPQQG